ncbi:redoxin domain-containing protein [Parapedobacter deserti]|uniref:Redoxin domain-containing protein n=1 Tax=Parapedobacter deserti TaxID=1912957 RepID=A0ABV7JSD5_9SPHI
MRTLLITIVTALLYVPNQVWGQPLKLAKNRPVYYEWSQKVWMNDEEIKNGSKSMAFRLIARTDNGGYKLEGRLMHERDKVASMDTGDPGNINTNNPAFLLPMALLDKPFTVLLHADGRLDTAIGMQQHLDEQLQHWQIAAETQDHLVNNLNMYTMFIRSCFPGRGEEDHMRTSETSRWLNKRSGLLDSMVSRTQDTDTLPDGTYASVRQELRLVKVTDPEVPAPLDTAWVNMMVEGSYWSDKLKKEAAFDSVAVVAYRDRYGDRFGADNVYRLTMLHLYQAITDYGGYHALIKTVPNSLLAGTHHMHNKLQNIYREDVDSAYALIKLMELSRLESLQDWIQHSFAQAFRPGHPNPAAGAVPLLARMLADSTLAADFKPLGQGVRAMDRAQDTAVLRQIAHEQLAADSADWLRGNPGRYNLLVYDLLRDAGQQAVADTLIRYTTMRLKAVVDTAPAEGPKANEKFLAQHLLAHALYLQYRDFQTADSARALTYLAQAASYAPKGPHEQSYGSFYDGAFLKSKHSYQFDYIEALIARGKRQEVKQLLIQTLLADPQQLGRIRELHDQSLPDTDFVTFFAEDMVASWPEAPDFVLNDLEEQPVTLERYRGNWLVLDFWGTWCGPCVEEMPSLDAFYRSEMTTGKLAGAQLLAIACYDTPAKVGKFMAETGYAIPVALSDGKVQNAYKISGYPTKVVISPTGRMMQFRYGADWKAVLAQFVELYPGG